MNKVEAITDNDEWELVSQFGFLERDRERESEREKERGGGSGEVRGGDGQEKPTLRKFLTLSGS